MSNRQAHDSIIWPHSIYLEIIFELFWLCVRAICSSPFVVALCAGRLATRLVTARSRFRFSGAGRPVNVPSDDEPVGSETRDRQIPEIGASWGLNFWGSFRITAPRMRPIP